MKKILFFTLILIAFLSSCAKKNNPGPTTTNVIEYDFVAENSGNYVVNYYDAETIGAGQNVSGSSWTGKITIPTGTKTANIFFSAVENPPFYANNTGTVTIKINGVIVASGSKQFINTSSLAQASYTFHGN